MKNNVMKLLVLALVMASPFTARAESTEVMLGGGLGVMSSNTGWSINGGVAFKVMPLQPLYLGLESGYLRFSPVTGSTVSYVPLMATSYYKFAIPNSSVSIYAGISAGVAFGSASVATFSTTNTTFAGLVRPGVSFDLSPGTALKVEPRFGTIDSTFTFNPVVNLGFSL